MRYEDTSNSVSNSATPEARNDADALATGSNGPATGNVITGAGTLTGLAGADGAPSGHVVEIRGAGGTDTAEKGQSMHVDGRFGALVIDENGNYKYVADGHAPEDFRDLFQYTLVDAKGGRSTADLMITRGAELKVADNAQRVVPGPDGVVTLPAGVDLNDVHVLGRDLIVTLPDGSQIVIVDGAVFVPQLVLGGVEVPSTNLASLLVQSELNTGAGPAQSSGGNFDVPVPPLDPGVPLGDLIPPTELHFGDPIFEEIGQVVDREPEIQIQPEDQTPSVAAQDSVDERGLPTRNGGEPAGSGESADGNGGNNSDTTETTTGTIIIASPDAPNSVSITVNGVTTVVSGAVGQVIAGQFGNLTITGFDGDNILYSYTLHDNTSGNDTHDDFIVTVTDNDGDQASATLRIDIIDDVPTARPDTDAVAAGTFGPETGNVLTGVGTTSGAAGADTVGADNAHISGVTGFNGSVDNDATGGFVVNGQYGVLTLQSDGSYSYTRNPGTPGGVNDVFNYTLLDGDGDTSTTTLTISIGDSTPQTGENPLIRFDDDALPGGNSGGVGDDSPDTVNASGTLAGSGGDGPITFAVQTTGAPAGFTYVSGGAGVVLIQQNGQTVLTVTVGANGSYSVVQNAPIDHPAGSDENNQSFTINYSVTDQDNDSASGSFTINVDDDTPIAHNDVDTMPVGAVGPETGNVISGAGTDGGAGGAGADSVGADTPGAITGLASNNVPANVDNNAAGGFVVVGQYGTLTMQADGSYSYTRTDGSPVGNVQDVFTYTLTDGDGDSTPATLTLNISDSGPNVGENPGVGLDDDALAGGNANGTGDDPNSVNATGTLSGSGGDGALTFAVDTSGAPAGFTYESGGAGIVLVKQGGVTVLTVTVGSNGSYSVVQNAPIDHVAGSDENNSDFTINYSVTDADGDSAPGTLNISVDDDTPRAFNDTDITNPATDTAVGNVITGVGTIEGAPNADSPGADGFSAISNLVGFNGSSDNNPAGGFSVNGEFGSLQMDANGNYTYTRSPGTPGGAVDTFTYTYLDGDGDPATATLTITIADNTPSLPDPATVHLDDDVIPGKGGNAAGTGDDAPDTVGQNVVNGQLNGSGGDGALTYSFTGANTLPAGFTVNVVDGDTVQVLQGATVVMTIDLNLTTGAFTVTQNNPILHPSLDGQAGDNTENNLDFSIGVQVKDIDNDADPATITINVDDDTPTINVTKGDDSAVSLTTDDAQTIGAATDTASTSANFGGVFGLTQSIGADGGPAGTLGFALNVSAPGVDSGLDQGGNSIFLYLIGGKVVGSTSATQVGVNAGNTVFDVGVNGSGVVTLTQYSQIDHPIAGDPSATGAPFADHIVSMADGLITLTASSTITDNDGDSATDSEVVNIGANLHFTDDGPSAAIVTTGQTVSLDETAGNQGDSNDTTGPLAVFAAVANVGDDPDVAGTGAIQFATNVSGLVASTGSTYGADGAGTTVFSLNIPSSGVDSGLNVTGGQDILLFKEGNLIVGRVSGGPFNGLAAFALSIDPSTGAVSMVEYLSIQHPNGANPDDSLSITNGSVQATVTVTDFDGDTSASSVNIGSLISFQDDGPTAGIATTGQTVSLDESAGNQIDSNDVTGPLAAFATVANVGDDPDVAGSGPIQFATNASALVAATGSAYGADGAGTTAFGLSVAPGGVDSGLDTTAGVNIFLFLENGVVVGRVGATAVAAATGPAAFALAINPATGAVSMVEYLSINHPNAANPDDSVAIINAAVQATVTVTDGDGDTATSSVNIGSLISFQDSGPVMTAAQNINIQNSGDVAHTGAFAFNLGADGANASNDVITNVTGSATVNGVAVTNYVLTPGAETATTASYSFSFDYPTGAGTTAHETGTLVFDKAAGTYTVDLANPIQGFTILQTASGTLFQGYEFGTSTLDGSQPAISVTQIQGTPGTPLASDLFVQFTSVAEPSSGTGDNNLEVTNWVPGSDNPAPINGGGDTSWSAGQLFNQVDGWVSTSGSANGVDGDTTQGGEVLDFTLVQGANPTGVLAQPATFGQASSMFLKFDGIGSAEDMIVVLKLFDPTTNTYTTRAVMVENGDIQKGPGSGPGAYSGITLDNNDGLVIIESNDYNLPGEHWVIVGAQIAGSDEGITGTAINLNGAIGAAGDSITAGAFDTQSFASDVNDGPFKISSIGFLTNNTTNQNAHLDFNVTVTDGDGDSITQPIAVDVTQSPDSASAATIPAANTTVAPVVLDLNGDGAQFVGTDAGVHYNYGNGSVATAWASPQDGILVNDANHNGTVDNASEFVFGSGSVTDLQALAAYDSNHDGQLSSADANFANFAVWQDANSNGVADAGEVQALPARGIASISLSSDGIAYAAAGGDVQVAGTGSYIRADGSTGSLADAAFLTGDRTATNSVLMGALAAAGLAAESAAAATTHASLTATTAMSSVAVAHTQALAPVAFEGDGGNHANDLLPAASGGAAPALAQSAASHASEAGAAHGLSVGNDTPSSHAPTELLQGTQSPVHDAAPAVAAASIAIPAAAQLAALANSSVGGAQHNQVVGQVLADALHGGAGEATIDSALAALPGHGGANAALEALASHAAAAVPNGDSGVFAAFTAGHSMLHMEAMAVHADAAPAHA